MKFTSPAIVDGFLKDEYGINTPEKDRIVYGIPKRSLPLEWSEVPAGTESLAIICMDYMNAEDEGVPWVHWLVSDIPADKAGLADDEAATGNLIEGMTSWALPYGPYEEIPDEAAIGYGGPAPGRTHEYEFELYAFDAKPQLERGFFINALRKFAEEHTIEKAVLKVNYRGSEE